MKTLTREDPKDLSFFDSRWYLRVRSESSDRELDHLLVLSHTQVCRDMELTVFNASAEYTIGFAELYEFRRSDGNPIVVTIENLTRSECVTGCVHSDGDAELVSLRFHCKEGFLDRCGECNQISMMACVMSRLLGNAEIDPADLCVNDAGMRVSSRVASWSEATEIEDYKSEWKDLRGRH